MKFGLLGQHIQYSKSKEIFEYHFNGMHTYDLVDTSMPSRELILCYSGMNVTTPYKTKVLDFLDKIDDLALQIGSVNCISNENGCLVGHNTDYLGLEKTLKPYPIKSILLCGNGGVSKTIVTYAQRNKIKITVCGIEGVYDKHYDDLDDSDYCVDCVINATKFGIVPNINFSKISSNCLVFDLCYGESTAFITKCIEVGHDKNIDGYTMLEGQAIASYKIWNLI